MIIHLRIGEFQSRYVRFIIFHLAFATPSRNWITFFKAFINQLHDFFPSAEKKEFFEAISKFLETLRTQRQTSLTCGMDLTFSVFMSMNMAELAPAYHRIKI